MTTIALDADLNMASDSMMSKGDIKMPHCVQKLWNIENYLIGVAGAYSEALAFIQWFEDLVETAQVQSITALEIPDPIIEQMDNFIALMVTPDGDVFLWEGSKFSMPISAPFAVGSGEAYAFAALECGVSARKAVEVAIKYDPYSGLDIQEICAQEAAEELTVEQLMKKHSKEDLAKMLTGDESV